MGDHIGIFSLIFKSPKYASFLERNIQKNTPKKDPETGEPLEWDFLFIVNPPYSKELPDYLWKNKIESIIIPPEASQDDLVPHPGRTIPDWIIGVYRGWNHAIDIGYKGGYNYLVLLNSDMYVAPGWLPPILKIAREGHAGCSQLVESGKLPSLPGLVSMDFGRTPETFKEEEFLAFAKSISQPGKRYNGGAFMPICMKTEHFLQKYPLGNFGRPGDQLFFYYLYLKRVQQYTALDSIVYHIQEGERDA